MKILFSLFLVILKTIVYAQNTDSLQLKGVGASRYVSIGVFQGSELNADDKSIYLLHSANSFERDQRYQLTVLDVEDGLNVSSTHDASKLLQANQSILFQAVFKGTWYFLCYENFNDSLRSYYLRSVAIIDDSLQFTNERYDAPLLDTIRALPLIHSARSIDEDRFVFSGYKETLVDNKDPDMVNELRSGRERLLFVFYPDNNSLSLIPSTSESTNAGESFFFDTFMINDSLYGVNWVKDGLLVFDTNFNVTGVREFSSSLTAPENIDYRVYFLNGAAFWGQDLVLASQAGRAFNEDTGEDIYFQIYDSAFALKYDERFYLEGRENIPIHNAFAALDSTWGVICSLEFPAYFSFNFLHAAYLRLYNRVTHENQLFTIPNLNISHLDDVIGVGNNKVLLAGYSLSDAFGSSPNYMYYLVDFNQVLSISNEVVSDDTMLLIYPNPSQAGHKVQVSWSDMAAQSWQLSLYDAQGRQVQEAQIAQGQESFELKLNDLPKGTYHLRATGKQKQVHTGTVLIE